MIRYQAKNHLTHWCTLCLHGCCFCFLHIIWNWVSEKMAFSVLYFSLELHKKLSCHNGVYLLEVLICLQTLSGVGCTSSKKIPWHVVTWEMCELKNFWENFTGSFYKRRLGLTQQCRSHIYNHNHCNCYSSLLTYRLMSQISSCSLVWAFIEFS